MFRICIVFHELLEEKEEESRHYLFGHVLEKDLLRAADRCGAIVFDKLVERVERLRPNVVLVLAKEYLEVLHGVVELDRGREVLGRVLAVSDEEGAVAVLELGRVALLALQQQLFGLLARDLALEPGVWLLRYVRLGHVAVLAV